MRYARGTDKSTAGPGAGAAGAVDPAADRHFPADDGPVTGETSLTVGVQSPHGMSVTTHSLRCLNCGFEAPADGDDWDHVDHPPMGTLTQCPNCGSTNIVGLR